MHTAMAIQCLPLSASDRADAFRLVDKAISVINASGLSYTVGPFETVVEGPLNQLFRVAEAAHYAILDGEKAKRGVATYIKVFSGDELGSSEEKTSKYREQGH